MIGVAAWVIYVLVWLFTAAFAARAIGSEFEGCPTDGLDRFMEALLGLLAGAFWPLAAPVMLVRWLADRETRSERRARLAVEKDHRVQELQFKIRRLEHELGIGTGRAS